MVVCEVTDGYERPLVTRLRRTEITMHVAHPNRVHAFVKAYGYEAETDPRDAQVLSRYGQVFPDALTLQRELEPEREALRDLLSRRRQFIRQRVQEMGRLVKGTTSIATRSTKHHIAWLEKEIARLDVEYREALEKCIPLADRAGRRAAHIGHIARLTAGTGLLGQQVADFPGGVSSLVTGQWEETGEPVDPRRSWHGTAGTVYGSDGNDKHGGCPQELLSAPSGERKGR